MSREPEYGPDHDDEPPEPPGHIGTTGPGVLVGFGVAGLVLGWALRWLTLHFTGHAPTVGWLPVGGLALAALIVGWAAWATYRSLHRRRERMEPHRAVNRLVLAKSCALVGALFAGGYFGYALSWVGVSDALAGLRITQSVLAGLSGLGIVAGSLFLERACRAPGKDD